jgi:hypothetical protein
LTLCRQAKKLYQLLPFQDKISMMYLESEETIGNYRFAILSNRERLNSGLLPHNELKMVPTGQAGQKPFLARHAAR